MSENKTQYPTWPLTVLRTFCPTQFYEECEGDLIEQFAFNVKQFGIAKARKRFVFTALRFFRLGILSRNRPSRNFTRLFMIRSHVTISLRYLLRHKFFTVINTIGLAIGIVAFFLIIQYLSFEMSYDQFYSNKNKLFRITFSQYKNGVQTNNSARNYCGLRALIRDNFPEIENVTAFDPVPANTGTLVKYREKMYMEPGKVLSVDTGFFNVFSSLLIKGDRSTVLKNPWSLIVSESVAKKIFGNDDPIGKHLANLQTFTSNPEFVVTGVFRDIPENAHFEATLMSPLGSANDTLSYYWEAPGFYTYAELNEKANPALVESRLNSLIEKMAESHPDMKGARMSLQRITDIHLHSDLKDELKANGKLSLIYILSMVAFSILVIAWINYVNIETGGFILRTKEIGIRRVVGSMKRNLVFQFLIQYGCLCALSLTIAVAVIFQMTPFLQFFTGLEVKAFRVDNPNVWMLAGGFFIVGSILTGIYPAFALIRMNPLSLIKGNLGSVGRSSIIRKSLLSVQFIAAVVLVGFLLVVTGQFRFMKILDKKIELENVISIINPTAYSDVSNETRFNEFKTFENRLLQNSSVKLVSSSSAIPGTEIGFNVINELKRKQTDQNDGVRYKFLFIDQNYIPLFGLPIVAGRNYNLNRGESENEGKLILNESAVRTLGFNSAEEAIGQRIYQDIWGFLTHDYEIIGVVADYHHQAAKTKVNPTIFWLNQRKFQVVYYSVKLNAKSNAHDAVVFLEKNWGEIFPGRPFDYFFQDEYYDRQFKAEIHFERMFWLLAGIAVFLSCLGLLGISVLEANTRTKEISIRKLLGASATNIFELLSVNYFKIAVVSMLLACPVLYMLCKQWLSNYPIRNEISAWVFLFPLVLILLIILISTFFQTLRAAVINPVSHLKHE